MAPPRARGASVEVPTVPPPSPPPEEKTLKGPNALGHPAGHKKSIALLHVANGICGAIPVVVSSRISSARQNQSSPLPSQNQSRPLVHADPVKLDALIRSNFYLQNSKEGPLCPWLLTSRQLIISHWGILLDINTERSLALAALIRTCFTNSGMT
nr:hypothetical protein Iba_chr01dCG13330 [Ipomoea batatas]